MEVSRYGLPTLWVERYAYNGLIVMRSVGKCKCKDMEIGKHALCRFNQFFPLQLFVGVGRIER